MLSQSFGIRGPPFPKHKHGPVKMGRLKLDEPVFTTRLSETATVHNLNRAFNALLDGLDLKTGADGRTRTLYSFRHFYATLNLERGVTTHALSRQLGNSTEMIDRHYSKYSPLLNAEVHSGRKVKSE